MTIKINGTNTTAQPSITGADTDTGLVYGTDQVQVVTGGTTRATVDSSGNAGIGSSSPTSISGYSGLTLNNATNGGFVDLQNNGTTALRLLTNGSVNNIETRTATPLVFLTNGTEEMRLLSGGGLTFNGDTAAANALDDYEEGTWSPTAIGYSGTMAVNSANYRKIGSLCYVNAYISFDGTTDSSGVEIGGLPFTAGGINNNYYLLSAQSNGGSQELMMRGQGTSTSLTAVHLSGSDGDAKPPYTNFANKFIMIGGSFITT